jgi:hypothetical protein
MAISLKTHKMIWAVPAVNVHFQIAVKTWSWTSHPQMTPQSSEKRRISWPRKKAPAKLNKIDVLSFELFLIKIVC